MVKQRWGAMSEEQKQRYSDDDGGSNAEGGGASASATVGAGDSAGEAKLPQSQPPAARTVTRKQKKQRPAGAPALPKTAWL